MPNWVKNIVRIEGHRDDVAKAINLMRDKNIDGYIDFNNIIPMPKRLKLTSGGYDRCYVALYIKTLDDVDKTSLMVKLNDRSVSFYRNYLRKYSESFTMDISEEKLKSMKCSLERDYKDLLPISMEDVGKAYIDNILEYGADTWYDWCCNNWGTKWNACDAEIGDDYLEFETAWSAPFPVISKLSHRFPELTFRHEYADEDLGSNCGIHIYKDGVEVSRDIFGSYDKAHEFASDLWGYDPEDLKGE